MDQIDNYKIIEKIGVGGMGEVYKGVDVMLEREVAIKLLRPELSSREDIVQRFRSEAVMLGKLNHPNIATVYNFGKTGDQYYMALEFVNGETLDSIIQREGALHWRLASEYVIKILEGLAHAHSFNIVHRDIKPSNIIVNENRTVKILDFGIARILQTARLTKTGHLIGTMEYISPEQIQGKDTDARSDIYSVGVAFYEMLTGHVPFEKDTEFELIKAHVEEKPKSFREVSKQIPEQLERIVLKALEKKPEKRYANAKDFAKALAALIETTETEKPLVSDKNWLATFFQEYPGLVFLSGLIIIGGGYVFWDSLSKNGEKSQPVLPAPEQANVPQIQPPIITQPVPEHKEIASVNRPIPETLPNSPESIQPEPIINIPPQSIAPNLPKEYTSEQPIKREVKKPEPVKHKPKSSDSQNKPIKQAGTTRQQTTNKNWLDSFSASQERKE